MCANDIFVLPQHFCAAEGASFLEGVNVILASNIGMRADKNK
jgi:hypothetical protein